MLPSSSSSPGGSPGGSPRNTRMQNPTSESESASAVEPTGASVSLSTVNVISIKNVLEKPITTRGEYKQSVRTMLFSLPSVKHASSTVSKTIFDLVTDQVDVTESKKLEGYNLLLYQSLNKLVSAGKVEESGGDHFLEDNSQDEIQLSEVAKLAMQSAIEPLRFEVPSEMMETLTLLDDFKKTPEAAPNAGQRFEIEPALTAMNMKKSDNLVPLVKDCIETGLKLPVHPFGDLTLLETWILKFIAVDKLSLLDENNIRLLKKHASTSRIIVLLQEKVKVKLKFS